MLRQRQNVLRPFHKRRNDNGKHGQPIVQVFAEEFPRHQIFQIAACRRDETDVAFQLFIGANSRERAFLQEAQQLHLHGDGEIADFIQKQRSAVRRFGQTDATFTRVRKRAFFMAEQFGFDQCLRQSRTVEDHKRLLAARRQALYRSRHQLFTSSTGATDQHRRVTGRDLADLLIHNSHLLAVADKLVRIVRKHAAQETIFLLQRLALRALFAADNRRFSRDVRYDFQKRHVLRQRTCVFLYLLINR